jgi:hypothetical protein
MSVQKGFLFIGLSMIVCMVFSQKNPPSLKLRSYQRGYISGVAPTATIELGGKETAAAAVSNTPEYLIYLVAYKVPYLKIERIWIKQQLYLATIDKVTNLPIVIQEGKKKDTLVKYTDEMVWQIKIIGKDSKGIKPNKDIEKQVKANELVIRLNDPSGHIYTRITKHIQILEAVRGQ